MAAERVTPVPGKQKELGDLVIKWTRDKSELPELNADGSVKDLAKFKQEMAHLVTFPGSVNRVVFVIPEVQDDKFTYYIRLPLKELVEESEQELQAVQDSFDQGGNAGGFSYPGLSFYEQFIGADPANRPYVDMLSRRIADYTFAHCK